MKSFFKIILLLLWVTKAAAQPADRITSKLINQIKISEIQKNLSIIAGPTMEGRETGTPGQAKAAQFIADYYKQIGLEPGNNGSFFQYYPLIKDSITQSNFNINGQPFTYEMDYILPGSINETRRIASSSKKDLNVVWGGYGISDPLYDNLKGIDVRDKALLVLNGEPRITDTTFFYTHNQNLNGRKELSTEENNYLFSHNQHPSRWSRLDAGTLLRAKAAAKLGAKVLFIVDKSLSWRKTSLSPIRVADENIKQESIPLSVYIISPQIAKMIIGSEEQYNKLIYSAGMTKPVSFNTPITFNASQEVIHKKIKASNVMAYIPGTDKKDEVLIISAHYDHLGKHNGEIFYGADDNGSGTTAVLAMAKAFAMAKATGKGPRRSILFLNVSGEEQGLWGSNYYTSHPVYPLSQTIADLNTDMIGRIDPLHQNDNNYIYIIGDDKLSSVLRPINVANNETFTKLNLDYKYNLASDPERIYYRSDHYNFAKNKIPVIFYFDGINTDYHKVTDTPDKINYELMYQRMKLIFYDAWSIANRDEKLPIDRNEK